MLELVSELGIRVYPVGRLDMYSEGLLLMTDDGALANRIMHPSSEIKKTYAVRLRGRHTAEEVASLEQPMSLDGYELRPVSVKLISADRKTQRGESVTDILITLSEGRNRQIRKMCDICGFSVIRLRRIGEGELTLGNLPTGKWRHLTKSEVAYLKGI